MQKDETTKQAEIQLAWVVLRKPTFTYEELHDRSSKNNNVDLIYWSDILSSFVDRGFLDKKDDSYSLTLPGKDYTDKLRSDSFGETLVKVDQSKAYGHFCELLYGKDLGQYSLTTMAQLEQLLLILKLDHRSKVLDLGCGVGRITEYISDITGATLTGLDFAEPVIRLAQERTLGKAERLRFVVGNLNQLDLTTASYDGIIAIDTLYFAADLTSTIGKLKTILRKPGQLGIFWSQMARTIEAVELLQPDKTRLAQALTANGLTFQTYDYTEAEKQHWRRTNELLIEMKSEFEAEGSLKLYEERVEETQDILELVNSDRVSRYLYYIQI